MKAVIIRIDGSKEVVDFDRTNSYEVLSTAVDGYIQQAPLDDIGVTMYCNEEGKIFQLEQNPTATSLWIDQWSETDVMVGNVICTSSIVDEDGNENGLTDEQVEYLLNYNRTAKFVGLHEGEPIFVYEETKDKETV